MRVVCAVEVDGRVLTLQTDDSVTGVTYAWFEGCLFEQAATRLEIALVTHVEQMQRDVAEIRCLAWGIRTCPDCGNTMCSFNPGTRDVPKPKENQAMPSKKDLQAAKKAGVNPYAVAQAAVNKGKISPSQKEDMVKGVTKSAVKKAKGCGKKKGK